MSSDPFKLIRITDEPPATLRQEVLGSVRFVTLMMRLAQLFVADYAQLLFDNIRLTRPGMESRGRSGSPPNSLN
jgi:hypothetical protein